jgi:hypothetical protein
VGADMKPENNNKSRSEGDIEKSIKELYKNLDFISYSYFAAEGVYPIWESIFALIIGQLIIAYSDKPKWILGISGFLFSICWYFIVSINYHWSEFRASAMSYLQSKISNEYKNLGKNFCAERPDLMPDLAKKKY